jgi:hypothetical protein
LSGWHEELSEMKTVPLAFGAISLHLAFFPAKGAEEMPAEIIAVQIRDQGYACDKALSAERDPKFSKPTKMLGSSNVRMPPTE